MVEGKGVEGWGVEVKGVEGWGVEGGGFGGEMGGVGEREGEGLGAFFLYL